jgi:hypothetical protein
LENISTWKNHTWELEYDSRIYLSDSDGKSRENLGVEVILNYNCMNKICNTESCSCT